MSLSNTTVKAIYQGDGSNATFAIPASVIVNVLTETKVYIRDETVPAVPVVTLKVMGISDDYQISGSNVVFNAGKIPTANQKILVIRVSDRTQTLDLQGSGGVPFESMEAAYDKEVAMIQELDERVSRSIKVNVTTGYTEAQLEIPQPVPGGVLLWKDTDDGWEFGAGTAASVISFNSRTGIVTPQAGDYGPGDVGLGSVNNTADTAKVIAGDVTGTLGASSVVKLQNVSIDSAAPTDGYVLKYIAGISKWTPSIPSGNGGSAIQWTEPANSPYLSTLNNMQAYSFGNGLAQELYAEYKVPSSYLAGTQLSLKFSIYSADTSNNFLMQTVSTLLRNNSDLVTSTTNQRTSTNTAITASGANQNKIQVVSADLTDTTGNINAVAVSANDIIIIKLTRGTDTATGNVIFLAKQCEVA